MSWGVAHSGGLSASERGSLLHRVEVDQSLRQGVSSCGSSRDSIVSHNGDVRETDPEYFYVHDTGDTGSNSNVVTDDEGPCNEHDDGREHIARLCWAATPEDDSRDARSDQKVIERHAEHGEERKDRAR